MKKLNESLNKLKKRLELKKFHSNIDSVDYEDLDNFDGNFDFADHDKYRKNDSIRTLFKEFHRDYYKPIKLLMGLQKEKLITSNIRIKEIDMRIYHPKNILM